MPGWSSAMPRGTRNCYSLNTERLDALNGAFSGLFNGLAAESAARRAATVSEPA